MAGMSHEPNKPQRKRWIRALTGAALLALGCVSTAAWIIEWIDRPQPIRAQWPHTDRWLMIVVLLPALVFWWFYFSYHWRGRVLLAECRAMAHQTVRQPLFWLFVIAALVCCLLMLSPGVRSAA
jgi:magnesium-transporting ATPase (P-type)